METNEPTLTLFERFNAWLQESVMIKLISIGFLVLVLLIPGAWIQSLIQERQQRADEAMDEVASKWSGSQTISGPVLVIPYIRQEIIDRGKEGTETIEHTEKAFFLPEKLDITGTVTPSVLRRGIFDAVVYSSALDVKSEFPVPDFKSLRIREDLVQWKDAYLVFGITDLRGISESPSFTLEGQSLAAEPANNIGISIASSGQDHVYSTTTTTAYPNFSTSGVSARLGWDTKDNFKGRVAVKLSLKGSKRLDFTPLGKTTSVKLGGNWRDPSFDGEFLPETRTVSEEGFEATWNVLHFNRPFSQQWVENGQHLGGSAFGVKLLLPVDQYQKSIRTAKYGALVILLTFISLFLVEITQKIRIHPFQYILVGAALIIYYTLLLSFSEHLGYNISYLISSIATVALISLYATTFLHTTRLRALFTGLLLVFYTFIFVIIQEQDYSLLIGSIGLFLIISMLMYFSRGINWYGQPRSQVESFKSKV